MELPSGWTGTSRGIIFVSSHPGQGGLFGDEAASESLMVVLHPDFCK